jgi:hypothetical protein
MEIIIALGSVGAFTAIYQLLSSYVQRHSGKELSLEKNGTKISLKGHSQPEAMDIIRQLAPELLDEETRTEEPKQKALRNREVT